jgi:Sulfotransferase family
MKILSITGWCRNGSTIIGNILNEIPGFLHVGEIHFLWKNSVSKGSNNLCGCRKPLTECDIWSEVLETVRPQGVSAEDHYAAVRRRQLAYVRTRHTWRVLKLGLHCDGIREHAELMARTYQTAAKLTGARVIVDTNKIPGESALLSHVDGVEPYFVHLVRDPRAVAGSWSGWKDYVYTMSSSRSTLYWRGFNTASAALLRAHPDRSMLLRYEDFIADPAAIIGSLLNLCGSDATNPMTGRTIELHTNHTVTGNPDRFETGSTLIRPTDDSWRKKLSKRAKLAAVTLSWPRFHRYGYRYAGTFAPAAEPVSAAGKR